MFDVANLFTAFHVVICWSRNFVRVLEDAGLKVVRVKDLLIADCISDGQSPFDMRARLKLEVSGAHTIRIQFARCFHSKIDVILCPNFVFSRILQILSRTLFCYVSRVHGGLVRRWQEKAESRIHWLRKDVLFAHWMRDEGFPHAAHTACDLKAKDRRAQVLYTENDLVNSGCCNLFAPWICKQSLLVFS